MKQYTASEARERFSEILSYVESGEKVEITKHGEPVAEITRRERKKIPEPGWGLKDGWSVEIADHFDAVPEGFEEYI
jgi:prevent-host-death family protein